MTSIRARWLRSPVVRIVGFAVGTLARRRLVRRAPRSGPPTGTELMAMSDKDFAAFIDASGIGTMTSARLARRDVSD